jgi:predicted enzyme related to lactoylglutathione lyase
MAVTETFFSVGVADMQRATTFYGQAFGATVMFASPGWSSLYIAGVRVALALDPAHRPGRIGLHLAVTDLGPARADLERAGGRVVQPPAEVAPGVVVAEVVDTEGNIFTLTQAPPATDQRSK